MKGLINLWVQPCMVPSYTIATVNMHDIHGYDQNMHYSLYHARSEHIPLVLAYVAISVGEYCIHASPYRAGLLQKALVHVISVFSQGYTTYIPGLAGLQGFPISWSTGKE